MRFVFRNGFWKGMAALLLSLSWLSCQKAPEDKGPELISVQVLESQLTLEQGGTGTLTFRVTPTDYVFSTDVAAADCPVSLVTINNVSPTHFRLASLARIGEAGTYTATLEDSGSGEDYAELIHLRIQDHGKMVLSSRFTVASAEKPFVPETGLPIIYLDTDAPVTSKEDYVNGMLRIDGQGIAEGLEETVCQVRGRGNTTWSWPKKPYTIKFDKKQSLFGLPKNKRWILLANFMDRTMMRNLLAMKVSSMTHLDWTPRCQSVELILNGKHVGNYLLIEQIRVDANRVPVTEMTPEDNDGEAVTGGYLLECDFHYDNQYQWLSPYGHANQWIEGRNDVIPFGIKYPDEEDVTPAQIAYIKDYVDKTAQALYGPDFTDPEKGYAAWLDVDSYIDYWLVFEVLGNHELGNPGSVYMHKDRGGKLIAGPVWDFDWGILSYKTSPQARTGLLNDKAIWYARLFEDPAFRAKVKARFEELLPQLETIPAYIDQLEKQLEKSAGLNFLMWNPAQDASQNGGQIINGDENMSFHDAVRLLRANYLERLSVIRAHL